MDGLHSVLLQRFGWFYGAPVPYNSVFRMDLCSKFVDISIRQLSLQVGGVPFVVGTRTS